eukprot:TRINITY_DN11565_c0_g1_i1.p2 TRINITY_DN11565_c0_g1~~TRINITY_DN11565_c0_g1_i1.p2  ORF type:complete len:116 (+),score=12.00 TRINITY_DN11565_c0_g1_i1:944-1291(+)
MGGGLEGLSAIWGDFYLPQSNPLQPLRSLGGYSLRSRKIFKPKKALPSPCQGFDRSVNEVRCNRVKPRFHPEEFFKSLPGFQFFNFKIFFPGGDCRGKNKHCTFLRSIKKKDMLQ